MTFFIYILQSEGNRRYYIGQTQDLRQRLTVHNAGRVRSTKGGIPWRIIHTESFTTRTEAAKREREIKDYKGGILFKKLLGQWKETHGEVA